jgi:hypothetical protein
MQGASIYPISEAIEREEGMVIFSFSQRQDRSQCPPVLGVKPLQPGEHGDGGGTG